MLFQVEYVFTESGNFWRRFYLLPFLDKRKNLYKVCQKAHFKGCPIVEPIDKFGDYAIIRKVF